MIFVLELPEGEPPQLWFAFDPLDLLNKLVVRGLLPAGAPNDDMLAAAQAADAALRAQGDCRIWWTEHQASAAFEDAADPLWQGEGWRARRALHEQLVALDVLADDL